MIAITPRSSTNITSLRSASYGGCKRDTARICCSPPRRSRTTPSDRTLDQSCPWVGLTHGLGWVEIFPLGLGQSANGFGWIGSDKMDQWTTLHQTLRGRSELSMGWVDPWVGLGWVGSRFFSFGKLRWVGSTIAKVLKFERTMLMHLKQG